MSNLLFQEVMYIFSVPRGILSPFETYLWPPTHWKTGITYGGNAWHFPRTKGLMQMLSRPRRKIHQGKIDIFVIFNSLSKIRIR